MRLIKNEFSRNRDKMAPLNISDFLRYSEVAEILASHKLGKTRQNVSDLVRRGRLKTTLRHGVQLIKKGDLGRYILEVQNRNRPKL